MSSNAATLFAAYPPAHGCRHHRRRFCSISLRVTPLGGLVPRDGRAPRRPLRRGAAGGGPGDHRERRRAALRRRGRRAGDHARRVPPAVDEGDADLRGPQLAAPVQPLSEALPPPRGRRHRRLQPPDDVVRHRARLLRPQGGERGGEHGKEMFFDYTVPPPEEPAGWPAYKANDRGLSTSSTAT